MKFWIVWKSCATSGNIFHSACGYRLIFTEKRTIMKTIRAGLPATIANSFINLVRILKEKLYNDYYPEKTH